MKKNVLVICLILAFFSSYKSIAQTDTLKQQNKFMVRHTVVFKFKPSIDSIEAQNFFIAAKKQVAVYFTCGAICYVICLYDSLAC